MKRRKVVTAHPVNPRPYTSRVVFYDTKPQGMLLPAAPAPSAPANPIDTITPILHELLSWQRKVNQRLKRIPGASQQLHAATPVMSPATVMSSSPATPSVPATPTLYVRMKPSRQGIIYSIPDRILGRNVGVLAGAGNPGTTGAVVALYEPWTENDQGVWMRCATGGWVQLWDRTTGTYFAD